MKRMLYVIIMILSVNLHAQTSIPEFFNSSDKQLHMGGCYVVSSMTTAYIYKTTGNKRTAIAVGLGTGIALGVAKELYDLKYGNPEIGDIAADVIGAGLGTFCISITF